MANMSFRPIGPIGYGGIGTSDEGHTPPLPAALTTDEFFSYKHAANEYIKLNNWIMDNRSGYRPEKEGRKCVRHPPSISFS
jgi:hypothetical protein